MKRLLPLLLLLAVTAYPQTTVIGGSGGGASAANDLSDVTLTSPADGDGWYYNGTAWVNGALFTAGTTDILAARMSANWGTAGTSACAASGGLLYDNGTAITCGPLTYNASASFLAAGTLRVEDADVNQASVEIYSAFNGGSNPFLMFSGQNNAGTRSYIAGISAIFDDRTPGSEDGRLRFFTETASASVEKMVIGGSQTVLIKDTTPTTGVTTDRCEDGAGQGVTACLQVQKFAAFDGVAFSALSTQANGSYTYCTDCTKATPCASGGSGAFAKRINGAWDCD